MPRTIRSVVSSNPGSNVSKSRSEKDRRAYGSVLVLRVLDNGEFVRGWEAAVAVLLVLLLVVDVDVVEVHAPHATGQVLLISARPHADAGMMSHLESCGSPKHFEFVAVLVDVDVVTVVVDTQWLHCTGQLLRYTTELSHRNRAACGLASAQSPPSTLPKQLGLEVVIVVVVPAVVELATADAVFTVAVRVGATGTVVVAVLLAAVAILTVVVLLVQVVVDSVMAALGVAVPVSAAVLVRVASGDAVVFVALAVGEHTLHIAGQLVSTNLTWHSSMSSTSPHKGDSTCPLQSCGT